MHVRHKRSPSRWSRPDDDVIKRKVGEKRQGTGMKRTKSGNGAVNAKKRRREMTDFISSHHETDGVVVEEDDGSFVEILDKGLDESSDDCASDSSSTRSGPSLSYYGRLSQIRCSACQKLYHKAKRLKAPLKYELLDNDPKSLTCDQWVLIKKRGLARIPNVKGKLFNNIHVVEKRLWGSKVKQREKPPACSRPHVYLKRNLRRCVQVPSKQEWKTNKSRKRTRDDSQGSSVAKQKRLHSNVRQQHISSVNDSHHSASAQNGISGFEDCTDQESTPAGPSSVMNATTTQLPSKQRSPKKVPMGFRELLLQLHGNSNIIVRETH